MFVFVEKQGTYLVGFFNPKNEWHTIKRGATLEEAEKYVHYLNGGNKE